MPSLQSRIFPVSGQYGNTDLRPDYHHLAPFDGGESPLSPVGNPSPTRGLFPPEFTYDFQTNRFFPDSFTSMRGSVDVITPVRNLALLAASAAGIKLT
jgi:hypothetical protein